MPLVLDCNKPEFQGFGGKYSSPGANALPLVYIIRADGEKIHSQSGAPQGDDLPALLNAGLAQAGKLLDAKKLEKMLTVLESANKAFVEGNYPVAIEKISRYTNTGCFAETAVNIDKLSAQMMDKAKEDLATAEAQLASEEEGFAGALVFASTARKFAKLPGFKALIAPKWKALRAKPETKALLAQADQIDKAQVQEAKSQPKRAGDIYRQVLAKYPDTASAKFAQERLAELGAAAEAGSSKSKAKGEQTAGGSAGSGTGSGSSGGSAGASGGADREAVQKKAASYLVMAKKLAQDKPEKAKVYAKKVIELVPDSDYAAAAQELIDSLK